MERVLSIFDVNAFLHTAMHKDTYRDIKEQGFYCGGINYIAKYISLELNKKHHVMLAFDSRSFRKDLDVEYKKGRVYNPYIVSQADVLKTILDKCGLTCLKYDGWEADDIIYWCVKSNYNNYNKIKILSNDRDLAINIKSDGKVFLESISSTVCSVTVDNFSSAVQRNKSIPFNTITAYKALVQDSSDSIKEFISSTGVKGSQIFDAYALECVSSGLPADSYTEMSTFVDFLKRYSEQHNFEQQDVNKLITRVKIAFPKIVSSTDWNNVKDDFEKDFSAIDMEKFIEFLSIFRRRDELRLFRRSAVQVSDETRKWLSSRANRIATGEYQIDENLIITPSKSFVDSESFNLNWF